MQDTLHVHECPPKMLNDGLQPQAHSEHGHLVRRCDGNNAHELTRFFGQARTRRQHNAIELHNSSGVDRIIAHHLHFHSTLADQHVFNVPGEGIVIIYQQNAH